MSVPTTIRVTVRCFAAVREALGQDLLAIDLPAGSTTAALRERLVARSPLLARLPVAYAVNRSYAGPDSVLADGDEVALIPPISGGSGGGGAGGGEPACTLAFSRAPLDARALEQQCRTDGDGAVVAFTGTTRDHNEGASVVSLAYEAYEEMAQATMQGIFAAARAKFPFTRARVAHRLGEVPVGEASVVVVVSSPHRGDAFDACRYLMDRLKHEVPIWKRERLRDGAGERWIGDLPRPEA